MQSLEKYRTPNTNKSMGIEIECLIKDWDEFTRDPLPVPDKYAHHGFFYAAGDSSIAEDLCTSAYEFVSQPLPAQWLKKEIRKLGKKWAWRENKSCGVHIHVSRKWLSETKAKAIYEFLNALKWGSRMDLFGRGGNEYCQYGSAWGHSRYLPINSENKHTYEFRVFKSGNAEWCCYCVDMVEYLINNAHHLNIDAIMAFRDQYKLE